MQRLFIRILAQCVGVLREEDYKLGIHCRDVSPTATLQGQKLEL